MIQEKHLRNLRSQLTFRQAMSRLLGYFLRGLLVVLPIGATVWLLYTLITKADTLIQQYFVNLHIPGIGILIIVLSITLVGMFATGFITRPLFELFDALMERAPGVKHVYSSVKDMTEAFVGDKRKFNEPVSVEVQDGIYRLGFITTQDLENINMPGHCGVYMPFSYAVSGQVWMVRKDKLKQLDAEASDVMKFILSGGVSNLGDEG
jgi:uncharacterized membrane protein